MADQNDNLRKQRLLIILGVVVALLFAAGNLINSLGTWQDKDSAETTQEPEPAE